MANKQGPGRKSTHTKDSGRVTPKGGVSQHRGAKVGRYISPEESGRVTAPIPDDVRRSPSWWGPVSVGVMLLGAAVIALGYMTSLPWVGQAWWLLLGVVIAGIGFAMVTRLH